MVPVLLAALALTSSALHSSGLHGSGLHSSGLHSSVLHGSGLDRTAPPFSAHIGPVSASELRWSWHAGCPVAPSQLRMVKLAYFGFDGEPHTGSLVVNASVAGPVVAVFRRLYAERFPLRRMDPVDAFRGSDEASMAADNTSAFNCRYAVAAGPRHWSAHAYGTAIDVNPVENPYLLTGVVHPAAGKAYLARSPARRGMAVAGGQLVRAFGAAGWRWGGRWTGSPDYQHFSSTGG
jgi:hypothetical protein